MNKVWLVFAHDDLEEAGFDNRYGDVPDDSNELIGVYSSQQAADETAEALRLEESGYSDSTRYFTVDEVGIIKIAQTANAAYRNHVISRKAFIPDRANKTNELKGETL